MKVLRAIVVVLGIVLVSSAAAAPVSHWTFEDDVPPGGHNTWPDYAVSDATGNGNVLSYWNGTWGDYRRSSDTPPAAMRPATPSSWSFDPGAMGTSGNGILFYDAAGHTGKPINPVFNFSDDFTLEGYFKTDGDKSAAGRMEVLFQSQASFNYLVNVNEGAPGEVRFAMSKVGGGEYPLARLTDRNYADGQWHYFVATYSKRTGPDAVSLTVLNEDGSRSSSYAVSSAGFDLATSNGNMFIGRQIHVPPRATFQGKIDELRISDQALPLGQLLAPVPQTVAYWQFEDNVGPGSHNSPGNDAVTDSSGNGNPLWYWAGGWGSYARSSDVPPPRITTRVQSPNRWSFNPGAMSATGNGTLFFEVGQFGNEMSFVDDFTLEGYFKTSQTTGLMELIHQGAGQQTYLVRMNEGGAGLLRFAMRGMDNAYHWVEMGDPSDPNNFADDEWHYFAARFDRQDGPDLLSLLVVNEDGESLRDSVLSATAWEPGFTSANMFIGRTWHLGQPYNTFRGLLDEFRVSQGYVPDGQLLSYIPEPGTLSLLALGGLGLWRRRRRRT